MSYFLVHPDSVLTWSHNWDDWLDYSSPPDEIESRQWTITPENSGSPTTPTLTNPTAEIVTAEGFVAGSIYRLSEHIVTSGGLEDTRTIVLRCDNT